MINPIKNPTSIVINPKDKGINKNCVTSLYTLTGSKKNCP